MLFNPFKTSFLVLIYTYDQSFCIILASGFVKVLVAILSTKIKLAFTRSSPLRYHPTYHHSFHFHTLPSCMVLAHFPAVDRKTSIDQRNLKPDIVYQHHQKINNAIHATFKLSIFLTITCHVLFCGIVILFTLKEPHCLARL